MLEVKTTKVMGRGIFATEDIKANTKIHEAYFIKAKDEEVDHCQTLAKYVFNYSKKYSVLCLGLGSLFNHSSSPSVEAYFDKNENGEIMEFWTVKDVKAGEELFISYGGDEYAFSHLLKK
jgi:SET domain-containing protein